MYSCGMKFHRDLLKHSSIYGLGEILTRMASVLMLPVYTYYLRPADYGVIAILDLFTNLLAVVIGAGLASAVSRYHFEAKSDDERQGVWWTGLIFVALSGIVLVLPTWLGRHPISELTLGADVLDGPEFYTLALCTMWCNCLDVVTSAYFRVRKWSLVFVLWAMFRLGLNLSLNLLFLNWGWGVRGILTGNLITGGVVLLVALAIVIPSLGRPRFNAPVLRKLFAFGSPLIGTALLGMLMHEADRWILRNFASMSEVGVYSLAYRLGQGVNQLILLPFVSIWSVVIYEIAARKDAERVYAGVFSYYVKATGLLLLGASLFSRPIIAILSADDYAAAADMLPIICLGYMLFGLHDHFQVPAMVQKKTLSLLPVSLFATVVNIIANLVLVPIWAGQGAAWASVITFLSFSAFGLFRYRRIATYPYELKKCAVLVVAMSATYAAVRMTTGGFDVVSILVAGVVWLTWAFALFAADARNFLNARKQRTAEQVPVNTTS